MFGEKGFTLIEVMVVISIISLLSSMTLLSVKEAKLKATIAAIKIIAHNIENNGQIYYGENNDKYANAPVSSNTLQAGRYICPTITDTNLGEWGFLGTQKGLDFLAQVQEKTKSTLADCAISEDAWVMSFSIDSSLLDSYGGSLCFDSSGNFTTSFHTRAQSKHEHFSLKLDKATFKCVLR